MACVLLINGMCNLNGNLRLLFPIILKCAKFLCDVMNVFLFSVFMAGVMAGKLFVLIYGRCDVRAIKERWGE